MHPHKIPIIAKAFLSHCDSRVQAQVLVEETEKKRITNNLNPNQAICWSLVVLAHKNFAGMLNRCVELLTVGGDLSMRCG